MSNYREIYEGIDKMHAEKAERDRREDADPMIKLLRLHREGLEKLTQARDNVTKCRQNIEDYRRLVG